MKISDAFNYVSVYAFIFTRLQFPPCEVLDEAIEKVVLCGIKLEYLIYHDQSNCTIC